MSKLQIDPKYFLYLSLSVAIVGTLLSLYFSDVLGLPPCTLCWYQRIAMYPLIPLLALGIYFKEKRIALYALPQAVIGLLIAAYHNLIYYDAMRNAGTSSLNIVDCGVGVPCTETQLLLFDFISIPLMSLAGFAIIVASLYYYRRQTK
jgi:disulfide bond formation protein DsbB